MSVVIAVCTKNYKLMMADTRICVFDNNDLTQFQISDETVRKYRVMNKNVCIGAAGDSYGIYVINNLMKNDKYTIDDYAEAILSIKPYLEQCVLPISFILVGHDRNNKNSIIAISSTNNFEIDRDTPSNDGERAYRAALPFTFTDVRKEYIKRIEDVVGKGFSDNEIETGLKNIFIEMSKVDETINDEIKMWSKVY